MECLSREGNYWVSPHVANDVARNAMFACGRRVKYAIYAASLAIFCARMDAHEIGFWCQCRAFRLDIFSMHTSRFHVFAWGTAALLVVLPALTKQSFGNAGEGNWCWIRGDEWVGRLASHDWCLLVATAALTISCIVTAKNVSVLNPAYRISLRDSQKLYMYSFGKAIRSTV